MVLVALAAAMALLGLEQPAGAETDPPPTPAGVKVKATGVGGADLTFDAESGSLASASSKTRAWAVPGARRNGMRGLYLSATRQPSYVRWGSGSIPQGRRHAAAKAWIRIGSHRASESVDLLTIANARNSRNFDFFVSAETGRFQWDIYRTSEDRSNFVAQQGRWYLVEVRVSFAGSQHTAEVRIDGVHQGTISSPGWDTTVRSVSVGSFTAKTHAQDYDDIAVDVSHSPAPWITGAGGSQVDVQWNPVVDPGSGLREYQIWRNGRWYGWKPAGVTQFVDPNPVAGAHYQLRAEDRHGNKSGWSTRTYVAAGN